MATAESFVLDSLDDVPEFFRKSNYRELLFLCSKSQLVLLAEYFELGISSSEKKGEILLRIIKATQETKSESKSMHEMEFERLQLEKLKLQGEENEKMRRHELMMREEKEKERQDREKERRDRERERERDRQHELEIIRLRDEIRGGSKFDINAAIKLVPSFQESEVVEFFLAFEKIAKQLEWPEETWTTLIQCKFIGKAQKEYINLSGEVSKD